MRAALGNSLEWTDFQDMVFDGTSLILLKAVHTATKLDCIFFFDSSVPVYTADLINYFMNLSPICK